MRTVTKVWLIVAGGLIVLGITAFGVAFMAVGGDMAGLSTNKYETNVHQITDEFKNIFIRSDIADIKIVESENDKCSVVCYEQSNLKHSVSVKDGALEIEIIDTRKWYEYISINFTTPTVTLYIPAGEYGALDISVSTGDVDMDLYMPEKYGFESIDVSTSTGRVMCGAVVKQGVNITTITGKIIANGVVADSMNLSASTGSIKLNGIECKGDVSVTVTTGDVSASGVKCRNFNSEGSTGKLKLEYLNAEEKITVKRSTGDVSFYDTDASELLIETSTGDVEGSVLSDKDFIVKTDTGEIDVPKTTGGRCEITTTTGDVEISVNK